MRTLLTATLFVTAFWASGVQAATLDRIRETGVLTIGYREDAAPYSFTDKVGGPAGYTVTLCRTVALGLKIQLELDKISIDYVPVTAENRFQAVQDGIEPPAFPEAELLQYADNTWGDTGKAIVNNWLGLVYQLTNLDRHEQFMPGVDADNPLGV